MFDAAAFDVPAIDDAFRAQQSEREWRVAIKRRGALDVAVLPDGVEWIDQDFDAKILGKLGSPTPHLSEPWYCCAEPTDQQLQSF